MAEITVTSNVNAPLSKVYASWHDDFTDIYKFHPGVETSFKLEESPVDQGVGVIRQCNMADGKNWIKEQMSYARQNSKIEVKVIKGSLPLKNGIATFQFKSLAVNKTYVSMTMKFDPKMGILGLLLLPMMKIQFKKMLQSLLESNASYVETEHKSKPSVALA